MKKFILSLLMVFGAVQTYAVLPPVHQSGKEMRMVLKDGRLYENLPAGEEILEIIRTEDGFAVFTTSYCIEVELKYMPSENLGPRQFELFFNKPVMRNDITVQN